MRTDVLAIGTELLLGQIVDTNSSWIGEQLAAVGIDTMEHRKVGDNLGRMVGAMREMLEVADAIEAGQPLSVLQAMKMENELSLPRGGTVTSLAAEPGQTVEQGQVLVVVE